MRHILKSKLRSLVAKRNDPSAMDPMSLTLHDAIRLVQKEQYEARHPAGARSELGKTVGRMKTNYVCDHGVFSVRS